MIRMILAAFLVSGCAYGIDQDNAPIETATNLPLDENFQNCGPAGVSCDPDDTDECVDHLCQCGFVIGDDPGEIRAEDCPLGDLECRFYIGYCKDGYDCLFGRCIESDPTGRPCEFTDECSNGNALACVEGYCSPTGCRPDEQGELNCNGLDDDCDGCVDGVRAPDGTCIHEEAEEFDVHFFVDPSGSMDGEDNVVKEVMCRFSEKFSGDSAYTFGTTLIPSYEVDGRPELLTDQTDYDSFMADIEDVHSVLQRDEPQYDAVYEAGTGELPISWRPGATRILVVFTDEEGQSFRENFGLSAVDQATMCSALTHGEVLIFFAPTVYSADFHDCSWLYEIHQSVDQLLDALTKRIDDPCY